jgi:Spy/CpxP family protein refolding chaperone
MKFSKALTVALVLTIIFAGVVAAEAMGPGRHHHGFDWNTLLKLNLSDAQKSQILSIYGKDDIKSVNTSLWQARRSFRTALSQVTSEDSIDGIVSAYLQQVAPLQQQLLSMRAKMVYEIKAVLTPAQLQQLQLLHRGK